MATRTPAEIRASIEANRADLGLAVQRLQGEVAKAADWRAHLRRHSRDRRPARRAPALAGGSTI
jgi:hypothetical protein